MKNQDLQAICASLYLLSLQKGSPFGKPLSLERMRGIEPPIAAWEAAVLPLNYIRKLYGRQVFAARIDFILQFPVQSVRQFPVRPVLPVLLVAPNQSVPLARLVLPARPVQV